MTARLPILSLLVVTAVLWLVPFAAHAAPPSCTLTANPSEVEEEEGFSLTLQSSSPDVTSGSINQGVGTVTIGTPKQIASITSNRTYVGTVTNSEGSGVCSEEVILIPQSSRPTCTLTASPTRVIPGQGFSLLLQSSSPGVTSGTVDKGVGTLSVGVPRQSISVTEGGTYTATVSNSGGSGTCSATIDVEFPSTGGGGGGGGGSNPAQMLQGLGQTLQGLQSLLGGNNAQNQACMGTWIPQCKCNERLRDGNCVGGGTNRRLCPCTNTTNQGVTSGVCMAPGQCLGQNTSSAGGPGGQSSSGLAGGLGALGQILQGLGTLMGQGGGGSGGGGAGSFPTYGGGCIQYYNTTVPSADPCAIYQPGTSGLLNPLQPGLASDLLDALGEESQTPVSETIGNNANASTSGQVSTSQTDVGTSTQLEDSLTGDVRLSPGATVFANLRQGLTEIAGFFGGNTFGGEGSQSALSRLCASRPWAANNFLGRLAPDTFFDGLCRAAGYQVGQVQQGGGGAPRQQTFTTETVSPPAATTTTAYIPPEADIRAEPASVRLGTRTYIFWASRGVDACAVRGPNFEQFTPAGAGATVPITGPTTFTIACTAPDGTTVSDSVTVRLAI